MATEEDVFDLFGRVAFKAQMFELTVGTLVITMKTITNGRFDEDEEEHRRLAQEFMDKLDRRTLGQIIGELKALVPGMADEIAETLGEALEARNRLIHGFFAEVMDDLQTPEGRDRVIENLETKLNVIRSADDISNARIEELHEMMREAGLMPPRAE
ncbi:hypothetical protein [Tsuneonella mangrovi]|uniref:hypothetical protein n=1 Tax=Tsuneonella mangrovi TaxID=1982042 RepID=UPI0012373F66|nr:hypothetical protein [Tsuneonella mangrovi]